MKINDPTLKKNIYQVPENYFDGLSAHIMAQTETSAASPARWWLQPTFKVAFASAMVFVVTLAAGWWYSSTFYQNNAPVANTLLKSTSENEIQNYLLTSDLSTYDLLEFAQEENLGIETEESASLEEQLLELDLEYTDFENIL